MVILNKDKLQKNDYKFVNEFYLQRILENKTNVFREKGASINSELVENEINIGDYFGLKLLTDSNLLSYKLDKED